MRIPTTLAAISIAASGILLLSACGGGDSGTSDKIKGVQTVAPTGSPPTTPAASAGAPAIKLPADVKVEIADPAPGKDAETTKAIGDLKYAIRALLDGTARGNGDVPSMTHAYTGVAGAYWTQRITAVRKSGQTITGTYRYYGLDMTLTGASGHGHYCEDQSKAFGKNLKTGTVHTTPVTADSYVYYTVDATRNADGTWQISQVNWSKGAKECVHG